MVLYPGIFAGGLVTPVEFEPTKFTFIGFVNGEGYPFAVGKDSPYRSLEDLQSAKEVTIASTGIASGTWTTAVIAAEALGLNYKLVTGFKGTPDCALATIRGDTDIYTGSVGTVKGQIEAGDLIPLFMISDERVDWLPDVPTVKELGYPELGAAGASIGTHRVIVGPPDIPDEILTILRDAFWEAVNEEDFVAWLKEGGRPVGPKNGPDTEKYIADSLASYQKYLPILRKAAEAK